MRRSKLTILKLRLTRNKYGKLTFFGNSLECSLLCRRLVPRERERERERVVRRLTHEEDSLPILTQNMAKDDNFLSFFTPGQSPGSIDIVLGNS